MYDPGLLLTSLQHMTVLREKGWTIRLAAAYIDNPRRDGRGFGRLLLHMDPELWESPPPFLAKQLAGNGFDVEGFANAHFAPVDAAAAMAAALPAEAVTGCSPSQTSGCSPRRRGRSGCLRECRFRSRCGTARCLMKRPQC